MRLELQRHVAEFGLTLIRMPNAGGGGEGGGCAAVDDASFLFSYISNQAVRPRHSTSASFHVSAKPCSVVYLGHHDTAHLPGLFEKNCPDMC
jgi:hypothetical protein